MRKTLIIASAVVLAACSRNPEPGYDETGRADTTFVRDTAWAPVVDTAVMDTARTPRWEDTTVTPVLPDTTMRRDTTVVYPDPRPDSVPRADSMPTPPNDIERDTTDIEPNVPDTTSSETP